MTIKRIVVEWIYTLAILIIFGYLIAGFQWYVTIGLVVCFLLIGLVVGAVVHFFGEIYLNWELSQEFDRKYGKKPATVKSPKEE